MPYVGISDTEALLGHHDILLQRDVVGSREMRASNYGVNIAGECSLDVLQSVYQACMAASEEDDSAMAAHQDE